MTAQSREFKSMTPSSRYRVHVLATGWVWHKDTEGSVARLLAHLGDYRGQTNIVDLSTWDCVPWEHFERAVSA